MAKVKYMPLVEGATAKTAGKWAAEVQGDEDQGEGLSQPTAKWQWLVLTHQHTGVKEALLHLMDMIKQHMTVVEWHMEAIEWQLRDLGVALNSIEHKLHWGHDIQAALLHCLLGNL